MKDKKVHAIYYWIHLLQEFKLEILDKKRTKNFVVDHIFRLELAEERNNDFPIDDSFLDE
ncbi:hypothetical protein CR513_15159, partial [Mucuna pruriens]